MKNYTCDLCKTQDVFFSEEGSTKGIMLCEQNIKGVKHWCRECREAYYDKIRELNAKKEKELQILVGKLKSSKEVN